MTFKVSYFGYFFGKFNSRHGISRLAIGEKRINTCKFCSSLNDTIEHVCYDCPISRLIFLRLQNFISDKISMHVIWSKPLILFNVCNQPASYKNFFLKALSIFRVVVLEQKILLIISNQVLLKKTAFVHSSCKQLDQNRISFSFSSKLRCNLGSSMHSTECLPSKFFKK